MANKFWDFRIRFPFFFISMDSCNLITFLSPINVSVIALLSYLPNLLILSAHAFSGCVKESACSAKSIPKQPPLTPNSPLLPATGGLDILLLC